MPTPHQAFLIGMVVMAALFSELYVSLKRPNEDELHSMKW